VQVIIHTAYGSFESAKEAVNLGAFAYVEKGTEHNELIRHVHRAFRTRLEQHAAHLEDAVAERTVELQEANEALARAANEWRTTFDATQDAVMFLDIDHRVLRANRAAAEFAGVAVDALVGRKCHEVVHDLDAPPDFCPFRKLKRAKQRVQLETQLADGGRWVAITMDPVLDEADNVTSAVHVATDITERKEAEETLLESETKYRRLVEGSPAIVYSFSSKRGGLFYSSRVTAILGYSPAYLLEHPFLWNESIHLDDLPKIRKAIDDARSDVGFDIEYRVKNSDDKWVWLRDCSLGTRHEGDEVLIEGIATDITDRRRSEERLRQRDAELVHLGRLAAMGELAAGLARELNQPLYAITNYATGIA